jgi:ribose transport system permease protein
MHRLPARRLRIEQVAANTSPAFPAAETVHPPVSRAAWLAARADVVLRLGLLLIIILAAIYFTIRTIPSGSIADIGSSIFISAGNLQGIARQMAVVGVIAIGETLVIITAGIDLSVGSLLGLCGVITAILYLDGWSTPPIIASVLIFALVIGLLNGFLVSTAKIPPFIVTLGMLGILRGAAYLMGNGLNSALPSTGDGAVFNAWVGSTFLGIPNIFIVLAILAAIASVFLRFTLRGRYIYAYGSNPEGARLSGINVRATLLTVYALSAVMAGVAGLLLTGRLNGANPNAGTSYELDAIAAAVLGGASLFGARGTIFGTFLGVLLVNMLANGIDLINVDAHVQQVIEGGLLILIVWLDQWRKRRISSAG